METIDRPKFRTDLVAQAVEHDGVPFVDVTDPASETSFRFYEVEYSIACAMDGSRDVHALVEWARLELGVETSSEELAAVVGTLATLGYLDAADAADAADADDESPAGDAIAASEIVDATDLIPAATHHAPVLERTAVDDILDQLGIGAGAGGDAAQAAEEFAAHVETVAMAPPAGLLAESAKAFDLPADDARPEADALAAEDAFFAGRAAPGADFAARLASAVDDAVNAPAAEHEVAPQDDDSFADLMDERPVRTTTEIPEIKIDLSEHERVTADAVYEAVRAARADDAGAAGNDASTTLPTAPMRTLLGLGAFGEAAALPPPREDRPAVTFRARSSDSAVTALPGAAIPLPAAPRSSRTLTPAPGERTRSLDPEPIPRDSGGRGAFLGIAAVVLVVGGLILYGIRGSGPKSGPTGVGGTKPAPMGAGAGVGGPASADAGRVAVAVADAGAQAEVVTPPLAPDAAVAPPTPTAKIALRGPAGAEVKAPVEGKLEWIAAAGTVLKAGESVARYKGAAALVAKIEDRRDSVKKHTAVMDKAKKAGDSAKVAKEAQAVKERVALVAKLEAELGTLSIPSPAGGTMQAAVKARKRGDKLQAGEVFARVASGPSVKVAAFRIAAPTVKVEAACRLALAKDRDVQFPGVVDEVEGDAVYVRLLGDAPASEGDEVVLLPN